MCDWEHPPEFVLHVYICEHQLLHGGVSITTLGMYTRASSSVSVIFSGCVEHSIRLGVRNSIRYSVCVCTCVHTHLYLSVVMIALVCVYMCVMEH